MRRHEVDRCSEWFFFWSLYNNVTDTEVRSLYFRSCQGLTFKDNFTEGQFWCSRVRLSTSKFFLFIYYFWKFCHTNYCRKLERDGLVLGLRRSRPLTGPVVRSPRRLCGGVNLRKEDCSNIPSTWTIVIGFVWDSYYDTRFFLHTNLKVGFLKSSPVGT